MKDLHIILNDSDQKGEGEHKILQYIKTNKLMNNTIIYGLDADLIMLALVSQKTNLYLLRERTEYNVENTDEEYIYLEIDTLKKYIIHSLDIKYKNRIDENQIINDYIFLCFLFGNDFINHLPSIHLRYNGHEILIQTYCKLQNIYQGYFQLIDLSLPNIIHFPFFKEFIQQLSLKENHFLKQKQLIRKKQYTRLYNQYSNEFNELKQYCLTRELSLQNIHLFHESKNDEVDKYKDMIFNLPIFFYPEEENILKSTIYYSDTNIEDVCKDYIQSLLWTSHYCFKECIHWKWCSRYNKAPFLKDIFKYLLDNNNFTIKKDVHALSNEEQLKYIFPQESHKLHSYKIHTKNPILKIDPYLNRYLWECHIEYL